jgi:hypothetical protein
VTEAEASRWPTADHGYAAVLVLVALCLWLPRLRGPLDLRYDAGVYYILGTSLAEGRGYRLLNEPGVIEAIQYPPLLPAVAAVHQRLLGTGDPVVVGHSLRLTAAALFIGYAVAVFALARRMVPSPFAFLATLLALLNVYGLVLSDYFSADVPYTAVSTFFFLAPPGLRSGLLAVCAFGLRTAGVALLAAWTAESVLRRRYRQAVIRGATAVAVLGAWQGYVARVKSDPAFARPAYAYQRADYQFYNVGYLENLSYVEPFRPELGRVTARQLAARVWTNMRGMPMRLGEAATVQQEWLVGVVNRVRERLPQAPIPEWTVSVTLGVMSALVIGGFVLLVRQGQWLLVLYVVGSVLLMVVTPWSEQFTRYLLPLAPFLALAFVSLPAAISARAARSGGWRWRAASGAGVALIGFVLVQRVYIVFKVFTEHHEPAVMTDRQGRVHHYPLFYYDRAWRLHNDALDWLRTTSLPRAVVATSTPYLTYIRTGLPAVMPPYEIDPVRAERLLEDVPVGYVVVDDPRLEYLDVTRRYAAPVVERAGNRWLLIYATNDSGPKIYRRAKANLSPSVESK